MNKAREQDILEHAVEKHLTERVKKLGGITRKLKWIARRGAPDRFVMLPGASAFFELKRPHGFNLAELQKLEQERLRAAGNLVFVCYTVGDVDRALSFYKPLQS